MAAFDNTRRDAIKMHADENIKGICLSVLGEPDFQSKTEWRYGSKGGLAIVVSGPNQGSYFDHELGKGGSVFHLIEVKHLGLDFAPSNFRRVLDETAKISGFNDHDAEIDAALVEARRAKAAAKAFEAANAKKDAAKLLTAKLWDRRQPIVEGSPAVVYFRSRGINAIPKSGLSYLPPVPDLAVQHSHLHSVVFWAMEDGIAVGGQRVMLAADGTRANVTPSKSTFGVVGGYPSFFPAIDRQSDDIVLSEGNETSLAIYYALGGKCDAAATFGVGNLQNANFPIDRRVILCLDTDPVVGTYPDGSDEAQRNEKAARAVDAAIQKHLARGVNLVVVTAPELAGSKLDLNDTLLRVGPATVRDAIDAAKPITRVDAVPIVTFARSYAPPAGSLNDARALVAAALAEWIRQALLWASRADFGVAPPVLPLIVQTGIGKTHAAIEAIKLLVPQLRVVGITAPVVIAIPRHRLGDEISAKFEDTDISVYSYRGRDQIDPENPHQFMCLRPDDAKAVESAGADLQSTLCRRGETKCPYFDQCGLQRQRSASADVFIVPHALLTRNPPTQIGRPTALFVDEDPTMSFFSGFERSGTRIAFADLKQPVANLENHTNADLIEMMTGSLLQHRRQAVSSSGSKI